MTKNYLIFIEKSTFNSDLTSLNIERIKFIKYYIMMQEFKYKFLIILEKDLLPIKSANYLKLEKYMYNNHPKFDKQFIESLYSNSKSKSDFEEEEENNDDVNNNDNMNSNKKEYKK